MSAPYTLSSLVGDYAFAIRGEGGRAPFASFGLLRFDGLGTVSGAFTENRQADESGTRALVRVPYQGTYSFSENGLGAIVLAGEAQADLRFVVQQTDMATGSPRVSELAVVFRAEDASTGSLRAGFGIRRPDGAVFDPRSLRGRYAGLAVARGGPTLIAGVGVNHYDGASTFSENNVASLPNAAGGGRVFAEGTDHGQFTMSAEGTGTVAGGEVLNIITRARVSDGVALAEEYFFMMKNVAPSGAHFSGIMRRISD